MNDGTPLSQGPGNITDFTVPLRLTAVQHALTSVDIALRDLRTEGTEREQAVGVDLIRRRLRRDLDRVARGQEMRAA